MRWNWLRLAVCVLLCISSIIPLTSIYSNEEASPPEIQVSLFSAEETVQPGHPIPVIIQLNIPEGWHTYWKNPGDAGMATQVEWVLPEGMQAGPLNWPTPKKFHLDGLIGYGYEGKTLLRTHILVPENFSSNHPIPLSVTIRWLVCSESMCVPGDSEATITLSVTSSSPMPNSIGQSLDRVAQLSIPEVVALAKPAQVVENSIEIQVPGSAQISEGAMVYFCPENPNVIDEKIDAVSLDKVGDSDLYRLRFKRPAEGGDTSSLKGVVVVMSKAQPDEIAYAFEVDTPILNSSSSSNSEDSLLMMIVLAFFGGMILNLMPCVLPILSLKIMQFVKLAGKNRWLSIKHGGAFVLGVLVSFWILAGGLLILRASGHAAGWGFQLQEPLFVAILAALLFLFSLNLFGVYEFGSSLASIAGTQARRRNASELSSSFFGGVLATAVATPCTGPFLGTAVGYALTVSAWQAMLVFTFLGLGLAIPYFILSAFPSLLRFLPKAGPWMDVFKQVLGFIVLLSVLWLLWVFSAQTGTLAMMFLLVGLFCLTLAAWVYGNWGSAINSVRSRYISYGVILICCIASGIAIKSASSPLLAQGNSQELAEASSWEPFSKKRLAELQASGVPVFIDFTAKWCLICQVNHLVLTSDTITNKFDELGVVRMKADWTSNDPEITEELHKHGRSGVPLYVLYGKDSTESPEILSQVLTQEIVLAALEST